MYEKIFSLCVLLLLTPSSALADLTGKWDANDGGAYYLRQIGNQLHWYGERFPTHTRWSNVFQGNINGNRIEGSWADVPKGHASGSGTLKLEIRENGNVLVALQKTGGFGGSRWTRVGYNSIPSTPPMPAPAALNEDCVGFNPDSTEVRRINGRWKIVDGSHWLFDFSNKENEARKALQIIRHYRMNKSCFVSRPHPDFEYLTRDGNAPAGPMAGEDCIAFNPHTAQAGNINGRWKIVDGSHALFDFGNKEQDARKALSVIRHYGFNQSCFVGRPGASFRYLRK